METASARFDPPVARASFRAEAELRFDAVLARLEDGLGGEPTLVARALRHGGIQLDGRPVTEDTAPAHVGAGTRVIAWALRQEPDPIPVSSRHVLRDADGVLAVDKPAWLPVQGTRASQRFSLEAALRELLACPSLHAIHRLDRETSGVVLFARDSRAASSLGRALAARRIRRSYLAITSPPPTAVRFEVRGGIARIPHAERFRFALTAPGAAAARPSATRFEVLASDGRRARVRAVPVTGRTHQIRVHLAAVGAPVDGDRLYGPDTPIDGAGERGSAARTLLHAHEIEWPDARGARVRVTSPLPADFPAFP